ncbi:MAG: hypothetical protein Q8R79_08110, partial [Legionellaceae bacterium]|nr:hypothetical protein [Legionellaceae bacterium]
MPSEADVAFQTRFEQWIKAFPPQDKEHLRMVVQFNQLVDFTTNMDVTQSAQHIDDAVKNMQPSKFNLKNFLNYMKSVLLYGQYRLAEYLSADSTSDAEKTLINPLMTILQKIYNDPLSINKDTFVTLTDNLSKWLKQAEHYNTSQDQYLAIYMVLKIMHLTLGDLNYLHKKTVDPLIGNVNVNVEKMRILLDTTKNVMEKKASAKPSETADAFDKLQDSMSSVSTQVHQLKQVEPIATALKTVQEHLEAECSALFTPDSTVDAKKSLSAHLEIITALISL